MFRLPITATAPFCPSEVRGSIRVDPRSPLWTRLLKFAGPGLLVSVDYMDPGNWATDIAAGSQYGYDLLFIVLLSSLAAMVLQGLSLRNAPSTALLSWALFVIIVAANLWLMIQLFAA